jgi:thiamine-phosphate pyrophosphorylase
LASILLPSPEALREALARARIYLIFTPELCARRDPLEVLSAALPWVDMIQVRPKPRETGLQPLHASIAAPTSARELYDWCRRVLELVRAQPRIIPVIANDRVDVAKSLAAEGLAGVHLGQDDFPVESAREILGGAALIGLSTHSPAQVVRAQEQALDYLGFGPFRPTATKGYERGLGSAACWVAQQASHWPVFPIGGVDVASAGELSEISRAAVGSAILSAADPAAAARAIHELLGER